MSYNEKNLQVNWSELRRNADNCKFVSSRFCKLSPYSRICWLTYNFFLIWRNSPQWARTASFTRCLDYTRHTTVSRVLWTCDQVFAKTSTWQHPTLTTADIHAPDRIWTHSLSIWAAADRAATGTGNLLPYRKKKKEKRKKKKRKKKKRRKKMPTYTH